MRASIESSELYKIETVDSLLLSKRLIFSESVYSEYSEH